MVGRTERIWGTRTPFAREERWPVRVDPKLVDSPAADYVDRWVQSTCMLCSSGCATEIAVNDARMVSIRGRPMDVVNHG